MYFELAFIRVHQRLFSVFFININLHNFHILSSYFLHNQVIFNSQHCDRACIA